MLLFFYCIIQIFNQTVYIDAMSGRTCGNIFKLGDASTETSHAIGLKYRNSLWVFHHYFHDTHIFSDSHLCSALLCSLI